MSPTNAWLIAAGVALIIEMLTLDFIFLMLSVGALAAALAAVLGADIAIQVVVFAVVSIVGLFVVRPFALRHLRNTPQGVTNVDALVGRRALVLEPVDHLGGLVKIGGEHWTARLESASAPRIQVGTYVTVERIAGATAVVRPEDPTPPSTTSPEA
jgi:membrane protein implicated in regulation of membrane protease activity